MLTLADLQKQLKDKDDMIRRLMHQLSEKDKKIKEYECELDLLKTATKIAQRTQKKERCLAISAEPPVAKTSQEIRSLSIKQHTKSPTSRQAILNALQRNDFLKYSEHFEEMIACMYPVEFPKDAIIIKEGDTGSEAYVIEVGLVEVSKGGRKMLELGKENIFGELAMLHNCTRSATVKSLTACKLWAINRVLYQNIITSSYMLRRKQFQQFLRSVDQIKDLSDENISNIADALEEVHFDNGDCIIRKGAKGNTFYIISNGTVKVTETDGGKDAFLVKGQFFGEKVLEGNDVRNASVYACDPAGVDCLVLERSAYKKFIVRLSHGSSDGGITSAMTSLSWLAARLQLIGNVLDELELAAAAAIITVSDKEFCAFNGYKSSTGGDRQYANVKLTDLKAIATLGVGGFGRVELVQLRADPTKTFALKRMKKKYIVDMQQQQHVLNEKRILFETQSDFIIRLYKTFKDSKYVYLLTEVCLGGELWALLRDKGPFTENQTRFYVGCVVEALAHLHCKGLVYRDLKPENLLLDRIGYIKLVDFGFVKFVGFKGDKTWTFCGTPEYISPEVVLNRGQDFASDIWAIGILIYELLNGSPPFSGSEQMQTYNMILKGIESIDFPKKIGKTAKLLIKQLCRENPADRLGRGSRGLVDLQKHKWFDGFSWDALRKRTLKPPFVPTVKDSIDLRNFDKFSPDNDIPPDEISGWDKDF